MPLPIDEPEPSRPRATSGERLCPVCNVVIQGSLCKGCGIDLDTGELAAVPTATLDRSFAVEPLRRGRWQLRPWSDFARALTHECARGWLGTAVIVLWAIPLAALDLRPLLAALLAYVLADRARAALGSPVVIYYVPQQEPEAPELDPDAPLVRPWDLLVAGALGFGVTALTSPLVLLFLTPPRLQALQKAGLLAAANQHLAQVLALGTVFVSASVLALAIRLAPSARRHATGLGTRPYDVLELLHSGAKACVLLFPVLGLATQPLLLLPVLPFQLLLLGALASGWEDLHPARLLHALRTTPRYLELSLIAAAPTCLLTLLLVKLESLSTFLVASLGVLVATVVAVIAGIARQDCEASQEGEEDEGDDEGDDDS